MPASKLKLSSLLIPAMLICCATPAMAQQGVGVTHYQELSSSLDKQASAQTPKEATSPASWQRANFHPLLYPRSMALKGVEGCAVYQTRISVDGEVEALDVVRSVPDTLKTSALLQPAKLIKWQVPPGAEKSDEVKQFRINFCLGDTETSAQARCDQFAALPCDTH